MGRRRSWGAVDLQTLSFSYWLAKLRLLALGNDGRIRGKECKVGHLQKYAHAFFSVLLVDT